MTAGKRDRLITLQSYTATQDDYGGEVQAWTDLGQEWAQVVYGNGVEQRQAAMEGGELPASFLVPDNAMTRAVQVKDRISFDEGLWDISENKPANQPGERVLTAKRAT